MPAIVDKDTCTGCEGLDRPECVANCPYEAVGLAGRRAVVDEGLCDDCKICIAVCPVEAIALI